jgi:zinc transport system ATP-binding protein
MADVYYITCEDLSFAYDGNIAVRDLNFSVKNGDYLCVVGENGSGKSTLIKGLLRLLDPYRGRLLIGEGLKANNIGYLPQHRATQKDFPAGVYEVVLSGRLSLRGIRPFYTRADKQAAEENLNRLGVAGLRNRCYRELSGGQQQRVLLARALCAAEKLLILDEPAAGLDPLVTGDLYQLLGKINRETGMTIIMVSHDIEGAVTHGSKILHLKTEQLFFGSTKDYGASELGKQFLGRGRIQA